MNKLQLAKLKADCIEKAKRYEQLGIKKNLWAMHNGTFAVIVDSYRMFEYYTRQGYILYYTPIYTDIIK